MPSVRPKIVIYSDEKTIDKIQYIAELNKRKISNYCDILIQDHIRDFESKFGEIEIQKGKEETK